MSFTHKCPCGAEYTDNDPDLYFCPNCIEKRKKIAKSVDAKMVGHVSAKPKSDFQMYDEISKMRGSKFVSIADMGITLN